MKDISNIIRYGHNKGKHWKMKDTSNMHRYGEKNFFFGKRHTIKTKEKNRQKILELWQDLEYKEKQKISHINKYGHNKGKHWKVKDTSNMIKAKIGKPSSALGKHWKTQPRTKEQNQKNSEYQINHPNRKFSNTIIEQKIAKELDRRGICYQQNKGLCNIANVDFYLPEYRIVIECDGCYYHNCLIHYPNSHKDTRKADKKKTRILTHNNFNVYRFWEHDINESSEKCVNKIF